MNYDDIFRILLEPFLHLISQLEQHMKCWGMMVLPVVVRHPSIEPILVVLFLTDVKYIIFSWMSLIKELFDLGTTER